MRCPNCGHDVDENPRVVCINCGQLRKEHYTPSGAWNGEVIGCVEYMGREATAEEKKEMEKANRAAAKASS